MTLVELVVVLVILGAIAGLAISAIGTTADDARDQATRLTLTNLRNAIDGPYRLNVGRMPETVADLLRKPLSSDLYDPATGHGWNGPYVRAPMVRYRVGPVGSPGEDNYVHASFTTHYGQEDDFGVADAYGRPVVLQVPDLDSDDNYTPNELRLARLVSAGHDGEIETSRGQDFPTVASCGDDVVLYLYALDERELP